MTPSHSVENPVVSTARPFSASRPGPELTGGKGGKAAKPIILDVINPEVNVNGYRKSTPDVD